MKQANNNIWAPPTLTILPIEQDTNMGGPGFTDFAIFS
jgi:hypothetical protein